MGKRDDLIEYGIKTEDSDIRAHVSETSKTVYVFKTINAIKAIDKFCPPLVPAYQDGVVGKTAIGWLVKIDLIDDIRLLKFGSWDGWKEWKALKSTSEKGKWAVKCVLTLLKIGRFPLWVETNEHESRSVQIKGTDIIVFMEKRIQVKCDHKVGVTRNLFLQKSERNPLKMT